MCLKENFYFQIIVIISSHFSHTLLKHFQDTAVLIVNRVGITGTCQNTKESMHTLQCLCPSLLFQRQVFSARASCMDDTRKREASAELLYIGCA